MVTTISDDMFSPEAIVDPYTFFGRLREEDPAHWNEKYELWMITRHDDFVWAAVHPEFFSSETDKRDPRGPFPPIDESDLGLYKEMQTVFARWFLRTDRPRHTDMRRTVHTYFSPKALEPRQHMVRSAINELLDETDQTGHMDIMRDFAIPLPLSIIAQLMKMPYQNRRFIATMSKNLLYINLSDDDRLQKVAQGVNQMIEHLSPLVEERVAKSVDEDDLLSVLASGEKTGVFTRDEVVANAILMLVAGHETTINLIGNGTLAFIQHPGQWELLKQGAFEDPDTVTRATEECLRYDPPIKTVERIAAEDTELHGKVIRKGERVMLFIPGANRDPRHHIEPDKFRISRWPNTHVAFGSGIHHCVGAALARMEGQEVFRALAERYDSLSLETDGLEYQPSRTVRSLKSLPVSLN